MESALRNLSHSLYHYDVIKSLSLPLSDGLIEQAKLNHKARLRRIHCHDELSYRAFSQSMQSDLVSVVESIGASDVEKNALQEYLEYINNTPLPTIYGTSSTSA